MKPGEAKETSLSLSQRNIMDIVWEGGEVSASQVRDALESRGRKIAKNTVRTLLERMKEKGWLRHRSEGRMYLYSAVHAKRDAAAKKIVEVLDQFCDGSPETLMSTLLDYRGLSAEELSGVQNLLDSAKSQPDKDSETA